MNPVRLIMSNRKFVVVLSAVMVSLAAASTALGQRHCGQAVVVQRQQSYYTVPQQQYATQYVQKYVVLNQVNPYAYYSASALLEEEAVSNRLAAQVEALVQQRLDAALKAQVKHGQNATPVAPGLALMQNKCAKCHTEGSKKVVDEGAVAMFNAAGEWIGTAGMASASKTLAKRGAMPPPPADQLTDDEYLAIANWLDKLK